MAKIKNYTNYILGEEIIFPIKVSTSGVFSTEVPMRFRQTARTPDDHKNHDDLIHDIDRFCKEVNDADTKKEYFIVYSMSSDERSIVYKPGWGHGKAHCLSLYVSFLAVQIETCGRRQTCTKIEPGNLPEGIVHRRIPFDGFRLSSSMVDIAEIKAHKHHIPFTVEAFNYFVGIHDAIRALSIKMNSLKPDDILLKIESNDNKLLNG